MRSYRYHLRSIYERGEKRGDRTGVGTRSKFGVTMRFNVSLKSFPIVTSKYVWWKGVTTELCWFLKGKTNVDYLTDHGVTIWDEWADEDGELGPVYGKQLRSFPTPDGDTVDQLQQTIDNIQQNPESRRHVITLWNPGQLDEMRLPPCHGIMMQFYVNQYDRLDLMMCQRSADMFLGVPFNISSYALLLCLMAHHTGYDPGTLIHHLGDAHVYQNHTDQVEQLLDETPKKAPELEIDYQESMSDYEPEHFSLNNYTYGAKIDAPVAV